MSIEIDVKHNRHYKSVIVKYDGATIETQGLMDENEARDQADAFICSADKLDPTRLARIREALDDITSFIDLLEDGSERADDAKDAVNIISDLTDY